MWNFSTQSALVAIIVSIATTAALLLRSRRKLNWRFAYLATAVSLFYSTLLLDTIFQEKDWLIHVRMIIAGLILITATYFFDALMGEAGLTARERRRKTALVGTVICIVGLTPLALNLWVQVTSSTVVMLVLFARIQAVNRHAVEVESLAERTRLRYLSYGGLFTLFGILFDLAYLMNTPLPALGGLGVAIYMYFLSQALLFSRLLDLHELLGKAIVFGSLALILALLYGLLVIWAGSAPIFLFNTFVASSLILILYDPMRSLLEETTTRLFFREHVTFSRELRQIARRLATIIDLSQANDMVLDDIYDQKRATHTSIYLLDRAGLGFVRQAYRGPRPAMFLSGKKHPVIFRYWLKQNAPPLLKEALQHKIHQKTGDSLLNESVKTEESGMAEEEALLEGMAVAHADLMVPLKSSDELVGILCLRDERMSAAYTSDEISALMQVGEQLAITIANSRLFGELKEIDRLATLGEMSAGLAHEIRNPLAAIKGAAQAIDPKNIQGEDLELLDVMIEEVNRLNVVVVEFLDYARPFRGTFAPVSTNIALQKTLQLLKHDLDDTVELQSHFDDHLPDMNGDAEQLKQVFINLVLNAADAIKRVGTITVSCRGTDYAGRRFGYDPEDLTHIEIRISDNGPGIPPQLKDKIFIPFYTTKSKGTGLGLALCKRIVTHHGGTIYVESKPDEGTTFILRFPSLKANLRSIGAPKETERLSEPS
jgi:two-component system, NtrC family, sensor histidine kinase HydH